MAEQRFVVFFRGRMADGADPDRVRASLAKLFKVDGARVDAMFNGKKVVIKTGVDAATARSYEAALAKVGAVAEIAPVAPPPAAPAPPLPDEAAEGEAPTAAALAEAARTAPSRLRPDASGQAPPPPAAPDYSVAEPGAQLAEPVAFEPARIDTGHLDLAEVGVDLVEHESAPPPDYDLSGLSLDPPGTPLSR